MAKEVAQLIIGLRQARPHWGPRKLKKVLQHNHLELNHSGRQRHRRSAAPQGHVPGAPAAPAGAPGQPFAQVTGPNDLWCADFKGWFRTADGKRCDPLTITDAYSRFSCSSAGSLLRATRR